MGLFDKLKNVFNNQNNENVEIINIKTYLTDYFTSYWKAYNFWDEAMKNDLSVYNNIKNQIKKNYASHLNNQLTKELDDVINDSDLYDKIKSILTNEKELRKYILNNNDEIYMTINLDCYADSNHKMKLCNFDMTTYLTNNVLNVDLKYQNNFLRKDAMLLLDSFYKSLFSIDNQKYINKLDKLKIYYTITDNHIVYVDRSLLKSKSNKIAFDEFVNENTLTVKSFDDLINNIKEMWYFMLTNNNSHRVITWAKRNFNCLENFHPQKIIDTLKVNIKNYIKSIDSELYNVTINDNVLNIEINKEILEERGFIKNIEDQNKNTQDLLAEIDKQLTPLIHDIRGSLKTLLRNGMSVKNINKNIDDIRFYNKNHSNIIEVDVSYSLYDKTPYPYEFKMLLSDKPKPEIYYELTATNLIVYIPKQLVRDFNVDLDNFEPFIDDIAYRFGEKLDLSGFFGRARNFLLEDAQVAIRNEIKKLVTNNEVFIKNIINLKLGTKIDPASKVSLIEYDKCKFELLTSSDLLKVIDRYDYYELQLKPINLTLTYQIE